ncbi:MAG TPA: hypothetical protein P5511_08710 [Candidatus Goldiibacteriota bacterium]|nr:hypothetical protein [Candidatus Goldiibacteriota bacterium]
MKRFAAVFLSIIIAISYSFAEDGQQDSSQEVVVKGQLKIKIESAKPEIPVTTDPNEVAESVVKTEENFMSLAPEDIKDVKFGLPETITEERPQYRAYLSNLETPPIFNLMPKMDKNIEMEKWNFKITDPTGNVVKADKGTGNLPQKLVWDGLDSNGQVLKLNAPYMYTLTYMDKAGNPGSVRSSKPKIVQAIKYYRDGKLYIEASANVLFEKERKDRFTDKGKEIIKEVEDYIKMSNKYPVEIYIYSEDAGLAKDQAESLMMIFDKSLKIPKNSYSVKGIKDTSVPKNYRIVFVIKS